MNLKKYLPYLYVGLPILVLILLFPFFQGAIRNHYLKRAKLAEKESMDRQAEDAYYKALLLDPNNTGILLSLAEVYERQGKPDQALTALEKCQKLEPDNADIPYRIGRVEIKEKQADKALESFKKALEMDPAHDKARNEAARILLREKKFEDASLLLRESTIVHPRDPESFLLMFLSLQELHREKEAFQVLEDSLKLPKPPPQALGYLLYRYEKNNDKEKMEYLFSRYSSVYQDNFDILNQIARTYEVWNEYDKAEAVLKTAVEHIKDDIEPGLRLGSFYLQRKRYKDAQQVVEALLKIEPNSSEVYCLLGLIHEGSGNYTQAEIEFLRCLSIREKQPIALNALAWMYLTVPRDSSLYKPRKALELSRKAVALKPEDGAIVDTYARALYAAGEYDQSLSFYTQNEQRGINIAYAFYGMAINNYRLNNKKQGDMFLYRALKAGFEDRKLLSIDSDIEEIRNNPDIIKLLQDKNE